MNMKNKLFLATAIIALAACSDNTYLGDENGANGSGGAISFGYNMPSATRPASDHTTSAAHLGNQFIVWGEKSSGTEDTKDAFTTGHLVFPNYIVNYEASTAYQTTSNTNDWEYVGLTKTTNYVNNITYKDVVTTPEVAAVTGTTDAQTIKYWDYQTESYTFTAVSASKLTNSKTDIENGYIKIQKNINNGTSPYNKGYKITVTANADLTKLYLSDRTVAKKESDYGKTVTLTFRNALSQIRAGIYETVPGYSVSSIKFYVDNGSGEQSLEAKVSSTSAFGAICPNIKGTGYAGDLTVTYSNETASLNQPVISASGTVNTNLILGTNTSTVNTTTPLGETATSPTWDTSGGDFTTVLLQGAHTTNLKLKCDYTLYNAKSGETIEIKGKTAEVPYQYLQWKPNYKYTYLFKITDDELKPITFDAVEIVAADGQAEYITTVSEPSITTFGVKGGKYSVGKNEYEVGTDIYITIVKDHAVVNPAFMSDTHLYKVTSTNETLYPITEASVAEAFEHPTGNQITVGHCICTAWSNANKAQKVTSVPAEDGTTITMNALKFSPASGDAGTYAVQYSYGSTEYNYTALTSAETSSWTEGVTSVEGYYVYDVGEYSAASGTYNKSITYYDRIATGTATKRVYKVIKVQ